MKRICIPPKDDDNPAVLSKNDIDEVVKFIKEQKAFFFEVCKSANCPQVFCFTRRYII